MTLLSPGRLWLLLVVVAVLAAYVVVHRRRRRRVVQFPNLPLLAAVLPTRTAWRRHLPAGAALLALGAGVVGLAHPATKQQVPRDGSVMLAIDVSGSMAATDVSPTRLQAAVAAAKGFLADAPERLRVGLVAFSDHAWVLNTPTTDRAAVRGSLDTLKPGPGTAAGEGLHTAIGAIGATSTATSNPTDKPAAAIVLLADGASTVGQSLQSAAAEAADAGVPVDTVAFGTDHGAVQVSGRTVAVPVETTALQAVAQTTDGTFFRAASTGELQRVYSQVGHGVGFETQVHELVPLFTGAMLALLIAAAAMALLWSPRLV